MNSSLHRMAISVLTLVTAVASATDLYIAPNGSDVNPGTQAKPFATLERTRDAIRELKKSGPLKEPVNVRLLGGTCLLYTSPSPRDRQKSRMPSSA